MIHIKSILSVLFLSILLGGCNNKGTETTAPPTPKDDNFQSLITVSEEQFKNTTMQLDTISKQTFAQTVHSSGMIDVPPQSRAVISAFEGGYIKKSPLLIGDSVKKGQVLVTLENPEFISLQQHYLENAEQLTYLKSEYERQKTLFDEKITSEKKYLKAESDFKTAVARHNSLKKNLQLLNINPTQVELGNISSEVNIYSPINGNVTQLFTGIGSYVSPADKIMEIMNTEHIHLELKVFEKDLLKLKKEQEINFRIPEASEDSFKAEVHLVGTSIDPQFRTTMIHGHILDEENHNFTAGMFVEAEIITSATQEYALPDDAIIEMNGSNYALLLQKKENGNYLFESKKVSIGSTYKGYTTINNAEQFSKDSRFLTKGGFVLLQGEGGGHDH